VWSVLFSITELAIEFLVTSIRESALTGQTQIHLLQRVQPL
jgi:hypothetical protein